MNRNQKQFVYIFILIIIIGMSTSCSNQNARDPSTVRIAFFPNITHAQALIGKAEGQFQKELGETYTIQWKEFNAGPAEIEAFFAGEVDLGYIGPGPAINGFTKSLGDLVIIGGAADAGALLVSGKDVQIENVQALAGKKIAIPQYGNTQHLALINLLNENGLVASSKGGTVEIIAVANPDIKTLLDSGEIDAAFVPEPWGSRLIIQIGAKVVLDYNKVFRDGQYSTAVVIARKEFVEENPHIVEKFLKAHIEITQYINSDLKHAKQVVNDEIKHLTGMEVELEVLERAFERLVITYDPQKGSILSFANLAKQAGFISTTPEIEQLIDLTLLNKVLKEKQLEEIK
ncbi:MAG: sulfate ABC transporter substrate-binding protein [Firmicutes bacterium HGW-Firmicutes-7]|nr:MAG: sulfate ABC transporter substrate-binding protein [Firmicutes bacterium HGW-Firmicutes-7]